MTMMLYPASPEAATRFLKFVNASPTPFHAVHNAAVRLEKAGFQKVEDRLQFSALTYLSVPRRFWRKMTGKRPLSLVVNIILPGRFMYSPIMMHSLTARQ